MRLFARAVGRPWFVLALVAPMIWLAPALFSHLAPSFRDQGDFFYPLKLWTADRLRQGEIPLWNPLSGAGEPWLANLQAGVFYPPTALFLLPSAALAGGLFLLFHFALAAWGTWRFLKDESVSDWGALMGAGLYTSTGFAASLSIFWNHFGAWAYLPAIAWIARAGLSTRSERLGFALLVALQAMAGSPEISGASLLLAAAMALAARPVDRPGWTKPPASRRLLRLAAAATLGLALAGWALVPFGELLLHSDRRSPLSASDRESGAVGSAATGSLLGLTQNSSGTSYLASLYIGPVALLAALAGALEKQKRRLAAVLLGAALLGLVMAVAMPPGTWLRMLPPWNRIRYPAKALALFFFGVSALAGLGLDALRFGSAAGRKFVAGASLIALALAAVSPLPIGVRILSGAGAVALLLLAAGRFEIGRGLLAAGAAGVILASLLLANGRLFAFAPEAELRRESQAVRFLAGVPGRVLTPPMSDLATWVLHDARFGAGTLRRQRDALLGYTNLLAGVRTVRTAAALPTRAAETMTETIDSARDLEQAAGPVSARLLWTPFEPTRLGSRKVGEFFRAPLNPYRARISVVSDYRVVPSPEGAWRDVAAGRVDWRTTVVLDREPDPRPQRPSGPVIRIASVVEDLPERLTARVRTSAAGILVLTDLDYPGWRVRIDGRSAPLLEADGCFRAVALSAGDHRVEFTYKPLSVYAGAALTASAILLWLLLALRGEPRRAETLL